VKRALLVLAASGCLDAPGYSNTMYACDEACPTNFTCTGGTCVEAVGGGDLISLGGTFTMGCAAGLPGCNASWIEHEVELPPFAIQKDEVDQAAYERCVQGGVCVAPPALYDPVARPHAPVRNLSYEAADRYCSFIEMRLPTEAEWEHAARTGAELYPWGDAMPSCSLANYEPCTPDDTLDVDQLDPSRRGLHHVAGNVREWVFDYYRDDYYASAPRVDPKNTTESGTRVLRGGSFETAEPTLRVWFRDQADRTQPRADAGVRCAK